MMETVYIFEGVAGRLVEELLKGTVAGRGYVKRGISVIFEPTGGQPFTECTLFPNQIKRTNRNKAVCFLSRSSNIRIHTCPVELKINHIWIDFALEAFSGHFEKHYSSYSFFSDQISPPQCRKAFAAPHLSHFPKFRKVPISKDRRLFLSSENENPQKFPQNNLFFLIFLAPHFCPPPHFSRRQIDRKKL